LYGKTDEARVKNKMSKGDGMSWAEFTYPLMQAWDWWHMFVNNGVSMQIGGSDQYGNITAGIEAVKYISKSHPDSEILKKASKISSPFGFTAPLMTTASGAKFGKSAGNAVWLDSTMTSTFDLYGYFLRTSDADVGGQLKMLTFLPIEHIEQLVAEHAQDASSRKAQHALAREVVSLVHGADAARDAEQQHRLLFGGASTTTNEKPAVDIKLPRSLIYNKPIGRILQAAGLAATASEGQRLAQNAGAYIGSKTGANDTAVTWNQLKSWQTESIPNFTLHDDLLFFRKGKQNIKIVQVVSDDEYESSGERYVGMDEQWRSTTRSS
jgi:tyrosyl-tRNA synthetase